MQLGNFLKREYPQATDAERDAAFAARCGCHATTIWRIRKGETSPSKKLGKRIIEETRGKVTWKEMMG